MVITMTAKSVGRFTVVKDLEDIVKKTGTEGNAEQNGGTQWRIQ